VNIDAGTALAIVGAIVGAIGALNSWRTARTSAKKTEVDNLRGIINTQSEHIASQDTRIDRLEAERDEQDARIDRLEAERDELRSRLTEIEARYKDLCEWVLQLGYDPIARKKITGPLSGGGL